MSDEHASDGPAFADAADGAATASPGYSSGLAIRRRVLGSGYVDRALSGQDPVGGDFQRLVTEWVWGSVWTRPGLSLRDRSLITLGVLTALNQGDELALHVQGAIYNGCTEQEIEETLMQAGAYCGASGTATAFRIANRVLQRHSGAQASESESR